MTGANPATEAARALVDALIFHGVHRVVLSPGSRSAPLAYALARAESRGRIEVHVRIDERVAAFTALGLARFGPRSEEHTSELQSRGHLVCRLLLEKKERAPGCENMLVNGGIVVQQLENGT